MTKRVSKNNLIYIWRAASFTSSCSHRAARDKEDGFYFSPSVTRLFLRGAMLILFSGLWLSPQGIVLFVCLWCKYKPRRRKKHHNINVTFLIWALWLKLAFSRWLKKQQWVDWKAAGDEGAECFWGAKVHREPPSWLLSQLLCLIWWIFATLRQLRQKHGNGPRILFLWAGHATDNAPTIS